MSHAENEGFPVEVAEDVVGSATTQLRRERIRRVVLLVALLLGGVGLAPGCSPSQPQATGARQLPRQAVGSADLQTDLPGTRPNIILIMADDMGYSDLGSYGSELDTPNLDQLAEAGIRFTQFHNAARCMPTRASLLTGLYPHQAGIGHMVGPGAGYEGIFSHNAITLAEALGAAGYDTYMAGKWHVTPWRPGTDEMARNGPTARGFERFYGIISSIRGYYDPPTLMEDGRELPRTTGDYHFTDAVTEHAVQYVEGQGDTPYFLYVAYSAPHFPLQAREADIAPYRGHFLEGWDALRDERYRRMVGLGLIDPTWPRPERDPQELPWDRIRPEYRAWFDERMAVYAGMITQMDRGIGAILEAVSARGDLDNTIVLFLSDNGGCAEEIGPRCQGGGCYPETRSGEPVRYGNDPRISPGPEDTYESVGLEWAGLANTPFRRYKSFVHEGGIATPFIVYWPSRIAPGIVGEQGHIIDIMPTLLQLAGAEYPQEYHGYAIQPMEGRSLLPLFQGGTRPDTVYVWEHEGNRAIRVGDWKLVSRLGDDWELHDMSRDRLEANDLAGQMPERVAAMAALYRQWAERTGIRAWSGTQTPIGVEDLTIYTRYPWNPSGYPWGPGR